MKKYAVLSIDVEDWHHLDYFSSLKINKDYSMLDGLSNYIEIVEDHNIKSTFFALSSVASIVKDELVYAVRNNHELASHGVSHKRPLTLSKNDFIEDARSSKESLEDIIGSEILGYRAPCFSLNNDLIKNLIEIGYKYDSSAINFTKHPLYGMIDLELFNRKLDNVYQFGSFTEFELPTRKLMNRNIPISGGGYLRIFPWLVMKNLISSFIKNNQTYFLYIHPFELSKTKPKKVNNVGILRDFRFRYGQSNTPKKLNSLIYLLKSQGFEFLTFKALMSIALKDE